MDKTTQQFLSIKYPEILKELQTHEKNATAQISVLTPVDRDQYIEVLATAGKGMHIDVLVEKVHGVTKGAALFVPNKKRTSTWLNQNSSDTVRKGIAGPVEKVAVIDGKATPATYKLTKEALAKYQESTGADAGTDLENLTTGEGEQSEEQTPPPVAKKPTAKRQTANG